MRYAQEIAKAMYAPNEVPRDVVREIDVVGELCEMAGGALVSRQIVAELIRRVEDRR